LPALLDEKGERRSKGQRARERTSLRAKEGGRERERESERAGARKSEEGRERKKEEGREKERESEESASDEEERGRRGLAKVRGENAIGRGAEARRGMVPWREPEDSKLRNSNRQSSAGVRTTRSLWQCGPK